MSQYPLIDQYIGLMDPLRVLSQNVEYQSASIRKTFPTMDPKDENYFLQEVLKECEAPTLNKGTFHHFGSIDFTSCEHKFLCTYIQYLNAENRTRYKDILGKENGYTLAMCEMYREMEEFIQGRGKGVVDVIMYEFKAGIASNITQPKIAKEGHAGLMFIPIMAFSVNNPDKKVNLVYAIFHIFYHGLFVSKENCIVKYFDVDLSLPLIDNKKHFRKGINVRGDLYDEYKGERVAKELYAEHHINLGNIDNYTRDILYRVDLEMPEVLNTWGQCDMEMVRMLLGN